MAVVMNQNIDGVGQDGRSLPVGLIKILMVLVRMAVTLVSLLYFYNIDGIGLDGCVLQVSPEMLHVFRSDVFI